MNKIEIECVKKKQNQNTTETQLIDLRSFRERKKEFDDQ